MSANFATVHPIDLKFIHHFSVVVVRVLIAWFLDLTFCFWIRIENLSFRILLILEENVWLLRNKVDILSIRIVLAQISERFRGYYTPGWFWLANLTVSNYRVSTGMGMTNPSISWLEVCIIRNKVGLWGCQTWFFSSPPSFFSSLFPPREHHFFSVSLSLSFCLHHRLQRCDRNYASLTNSFLWCGTGETRVRRATLSTWGAPWETKKRLQPFKFRGCMNVPWTQFRRYSGRLETVRRTFCTQSLPF